MSSKKPKSAIDIVLGRLPSDILARLLGSPSPHDPAALRRRAALVSDGEEALRLLRARHAKLAPKGETQMARAALVVEYLGRNAPDDDAGGRYFRTTVPAAMLAKAAGFPQKKDMKKLERMQTVMASYLDGTSMDRKSGRGGGQRGRKRDASSLKPNAAAMASSSAASRQTLPPSELVRDLCIRLGPVIPDAEYAMAYAMGLMEALVNADGTERQSHTTTSKRRRFSKYELRKDMERHKEYYEAACFFLAVKKSEGENSQLLLKKPAKKAATKTKKDGKKTSGEEEGGEGDAAEEEQEEDEIEEKTLSEADVVAAANLLEGTFRTVLQFVRDWTEGMTIDTTRRGAGGDGLCGGPKALFEVADKGDAGADKSKSEPIESAFDQWKRKVLQDAKASVVSKMGSNESGDWLSIAANEVLCKAGL